MRVGLLRVSEDPSQSMESNHPIRGYEPRPCNQHRLRNFARPSEKAAMEFGFPYEGNCRHGIASKNGGGDQESNLMFLRVGLRRVGAQSVDEGNRTLVPRVKDAGTCRCTTSTE